MKLFITRHAQKELNHIIDPFAQNILKKIQELSDTPYPVNSKKLQGQNNYRLRIGNFRVLYTVDLKMKEITILRIADRKTIYR